MRKVVLSAAIGICVGACNSTVEPIKTPVLNSIPSGPAPVGALPQMPRAELAAVVERNVSSGTAFGKSSPAFVEAGVAEIVRKLDRGEATAYCVWGKTKMMGIPNTRWWLVNLGVTDRGIPILLFDRWSDGQPRQCPAQEATQPFPELIAARAARRAEGGASPAPATAVPAQPMTSHTPVTISAPTDGRAGQ